MKRNHWLIFILFIFIGLAFIHANLPDDIYAVYVSPFIIPLEGEITVKFRQPYWIEEDKIYLKHTGLDISGEEGEAIRASGNGIVTYIGFSPIGGRTIVIKHNEKIRTTYLNFSNCFVSPGSTVKQGDIIALIGALDDPSSPGPHLHFGIIYNGKYLDPEDVLNLDCSSLTQFISLEYVEKDFGLSLP